MNSLSWLLYFAEVAGKLGFAMGFASIVMLVGLAFLGAIFMGTIFDADVKMPTMVIRPYLTLLAFVGSIYIITPSKQTLYLIAGSEAGEAVVTSEEGQEILDDIRQVIKHQLEVLKAGQQ